MKTPTIISMKDIRLSIAAIARRAESGERFIVVRDSRPVFQIEPLATILPSVPAPPMSFEEFKAKIDSVREPDDMAWTPEAVEEIIQEMYRERGANGNQPKKNDRGEHRRKKAG